LTTTSTDLAVTRSFDNGAEACANINTREEPGRFETTGKD